MAAAGWRNSILSQVLVTLAINGPVGSSWHGRGIQQMSRIAKVSLQETLVSNGVHISMFSGQRTPACEIVRSESGEYPAWITGVGAWLFSDKSGKSGLEALQDRWASSEDGQRLRLMLELDGMFGLFLPGRASAQCFVCTDCLGSLHLYVMQIADGCVMISTSSLVLAAVRRFGWDKEALQQYFSYGSVFEGRSLFEGVTKLPAGSVVEIGPNGPTSAQVYWRPADYCHDRVPRIGGAEELASCLKDIVSRIASAYKKPILDLTGGFDSRAVFGAMINAGHAFQTITVGELDDADVEVARHISEAFQCPHVVQPRFDQDVESVWRRCWNAVALVDGETDVLEYIGALRTHEWSSSQFDCSLNGSLGEICKGQWWEAMLPYIGRRGHWEADSRSVAISRFAVQDTPDTLLSFGFERSLVDCYTEIVREATKEVRDLPNTALVDLAYLKLRMQRWQGRYSSATLRIWPCWSPFAFRQVLELALSSPKEVRIRHRLMRRLIEYQNPRLARFPLAQGYPALPLRWDTFHLFYPLVREVGYKASQHLARRLAWQARLSESTSQSPLDRLSKTDEGAELLNPQNMMTKELYQTDRLCRFLSGRNGSRGDESVKGRILTLEMVARVVSSKV